MAIYPAYSHSQLNIGHINNKNLTGNVYPNADVFGSVHHGLFTDGVPKYSRVVTHLGASAILWKATISSVMSVCLFIHSSIPFVHIKQLVHRAMHFH